jgi:hypothetical protein
MVDLLLLQKVEQELEYYKLELKQKIISLKPHLKRRGERNKYD